MADVTRKVRPIVQRAGRLTNKFVLPTVKEILEAPPNPYLLYEAIRRRETGPYKNPWIRTKHAPPKGSTAYGPVQITSKLVRDFWNRYEDRMMPHKEYIRRFLAQGRKFAYYGKEKKRKGYLPKYDYGGSGDLTTPRDRRDYRRMALTLLAIKIKNNKNVAAVVDSWRGVGKDPKYVRDVLVNYVKLYRARKRALLQKQLNQQRLQRRTNYSQRMKPSKEYFNARNRLQSSPLGRPR